MSCSDHAPVDCELEEQSWRSSHACIHYTEAAQQNALLPLLREVLKKGESAASSQKHHGCKHTAHPLYQATQRDKQSHARRLQRNSTGDNNHHSRDEADTLALWSVAFTQANARLSQHAPLLNANDCTATKAPCGEDAVLRLAGVHIHLLSTNAVVRTQRVPVRLFISPVRQQGLRVPWHLACLLNSTFFLRTQIN